MENKSKFIDIQQDPCKIVEPEKKPIDRVCPTCVPNPSYIPPEWWKQEGPWLNEKTCEYSIAVFVNQEGDNYRLSDLKNILEPEKTTISESGIPKSPAMSATAMQEKDSKIKNNERFDRIKRSFVKPGIRSMLRHYNKIETDEIVCARNDCSIFTTSEAKSAVRQIKHFASLNSDIAFSEWQSNSDINDSLPKPIDNQNALELFANATEYHFYGMSDNAMAVLVSIPAHIFDQIPNAPTIPEVNTDIEKVRFKVTEFTSWISKMESVFVLFSKFQSFYNKTENGKLFQLIDGEETPFYTKLLEGRFEKFENKLSGLLESNGYEYYNYFSRLVSYETSKTAIEIELTFDKSDENKPFRLTDTIKVKTPGCSDITIKLPDEPNDDFLSAGDSIRAIAFRDQTLMAYIANYENIKRQIEAQKNPPWLDFLVENTYPPISVEYGDTLNSKTNALGCLADKFSGLDDYILDKSMSFFDSFEYQMNKNNCRLQKDRNKGKPTVYSTESELKKLEKAEQEKRRRQLIKKGILEDPNIKNQTNTGDMEENKIRQLLNRLSPCSWRKITIKAINCLMSGMTLEEGYRELIKGTIGSLTTEGMEILLQGLPADKQEKVRETIEKEFKDLPAPWEVGYEPGDIEAAYDRTAQQNIDQKIAVGDSYDELSAILDTKRSELERSKATGPKYDEYLKTKQAQTDKQTEDTARTQQKIDNLTMSIVNASNELNFIVMQIESAQADLRRAEQGNLQAPIDTVNETIKQLRIKYDSTEQKRDADQDALNAAKQEIQQIKNVTVTVLSQAQYEATFNQNLQKLETEIASLEIRVQEALQNLREEVQRDASFIGFNELSEEEQQKIIEKEKEKLTFVTAGEGDRIKQGTYGRAVGNVQKELMGAYGQAIIENASVAEIIEGINKLPGAKLIGEFFASFDCPSYQFAKPPLDEFLGTFTVGACGKGKTRPFLLPELKEFPASWSIWKGLKETFTFSFKKSMTQVVSAMILKSIQALEAGVCQALSFSTQSGADLLNASKNGGRFPRSLEEIVADVICADENNEDERNKKIDKLFALMGAPKRGNTTPKDVLATMSTLGSERDYLKAMIGEAEPGFLKNVSRTLSLIHPEYPSLGTEEGLDVAMQNAGNTLTEDQRDAATQIANSPEQFFPLDSSICLTNEQAQRYYQDLQNMYANQIGDEDIAKQFVEDQKAKSRGDLNDLADIMSKGPEGILQDAINDLFADPDPDCPVDKSLLKTPQEVTDAMEELSLGIFARLHKAFVDDTIEENMLERFFSSSIFADSMGILLMITADSVGYNYAKHMRVRNNLFFRLLAACGFFDNEAPFPETVGAQMRQKLLDQNPATDDDYKYDKQKSKIKLDYDNDFKGEKRVSSNMFIKETMKMKLNGGTFHNSNFDYQFHSVGESSYNFIVENTPSFEHEVYMKKFYPTMDEISFPTPALPIKGTNTFRNLVLKKYLEDKISQIDIVNLPIDKVADIVSNFNNVLFGNIKKRILSADGSDAPSNAFLHGGENEQIITVDDLTYVDPEPGATEYTYNEEDGILGRSLTSNKRIKFLDPLRHGGTFELPNIYIEPQMPYGWLSFAKIIVPQIDGCEPRGTRFLGLKQLEEEVAEKGNKIKKNEKLKESPECVVEIPFDKIAAPATLAALEQIITATIRVFITEFMINTFSIHGNLSLNNHNYDELLYEYIAKKMQQSLSSENSIFASTYEGYTYWLLFLEQCAQVYNRKLQLGEATSDPEVERALEAINDAQISYTKPTRDAGALFENDFLVSKTDPPNTIKEFLNIAKEQFDDVYAYPAVGGYLIAQNTRRWDKTFKPNFFATNVDDDNPDKIVIMRGGLDEKFYIPVGGFRYWTQNEMNFSAKIATIAENEKTAIVFLKRLIREQIEVYSDKIAAESSPRPLIYDINKYFIGASNEFLGNNVRAGLYDVEVPIGGASGIDEEVQVSSEFYGTINDCGKVDGTSALEMMELSESELNKISRIGGFYLEKYLKIIPKVPESSGNMGLRVAPSPAEQKEANSFSRPNNLPSGIFNIQDFIDFLKAQEIPENVNISDWFGNAEISSKNPEGYVGSIGIKFGVRVCYVSNEDLKSSIQFENEGHASDKSQEEKSFLSSKYPNIFVIPLVSYEKDVLDERLISFKEANGNFNQDIKCYIDGLVKTKEFDLIFNKVFNIKKVGSMLACYSDNNFLTSIGLGNNERKEPDLGILNIFDLGIEDIPDEDDRSLTFNDCKSECRKLFVSNYKRNDFDPPNEEEEVDNLSIATQKALDKTYALSLLDDDVSWRVRKRIKPNKPTDKNGKECQNQFGGLFNIKDRGL